MKAQQKLVVKLLLLLLPFALLLGLPLLVYGEIFNSNDITNMQLKRGIPKLYGTIRQNQYSYYKVEMARRLSPSVILLGDSRTLQIHNFFFNKDSRFYNAGIGGSITGNAASMQYFLEFQNTDSIDVAIICLSHFWFNENNREVIYTGHDFFAEAPSLSQTDMISIINFLEHICRLDAMKNTAQNLSSFERMGGTAIIHNNGILADGSYYYGKAYPNDSIGQTNEDRLSGTLDAIEKAEVRFEHGEKINTNTLNYLDQFLQYCTSNGIYVIAYAPPYAPSINDAMSAKGNAYAYQHDALDIIPSLFRKYGFEFYDYTDVTTLDCTDNHFLDGDHASEVVFLRMIIDMIEKGSRLADFCTLDDLRSFDENRYSDQRLFETFEEYSVLACQFTP